MAYSLRPEGAPALSSRCPDPLPAHKLSLLSGHFLGQGAKAVSGTVFGCGVRRCCRGRDLCPLAQGHARFCPEKAFSRERRVPASADWRQCAQEPRSDSSLRPCEPQTRRCLRARPGSGGHPSRPSESRGPSPTQLLFLRNEPRMAGGPQRLVGSVPKRVSVGGPTLIDISQSDGLLTGLLKALSGQGCL